MAGGYGPSPISLVTKAVTFDGNANLGQSGTNTTWFTISGEVMVVAISGFCTTSLTEAGATASITLGITGDTNLFIAATTAVDIDGSEFWISNAPAANGIALPAACKDILITDDILSAVASQNVNGGVLRIDCWWMPLSSGGSLVVA